MNDFVKYVRKYNLTLADDVVVTYDSVIRKVCRNEN